MIHGLEGSASLRMPGRVANDTRQLVSNIPHALHMPGHIWAQTGKWDEAVKSFDDAAVNERGYMKARLAVRKLAPWAQPPFPLDGIFFPRRLRQSRDLVSRVAGDEGESS